MSKGMAKAAARVARGKGSSLDRHRDQRRLEQLTRARELKEESRRQNEMKTARNAKRREKWSTHIVVDL